MNQSDRNCSQSNMISLKKPRCYCYCSWLFYSIGEPWPKIAQSVCRRNKFLLRALRYVARSLRCKRCLTGSPLEEPTHSPTWIWPKSSCLTSWLWIPACLKPRSTAPSVTPTWLTPSHACCCNMWGRSVAMDSQRVHFYLFSVNCDQSDSNTLLGTKLPEKAKALD